MRDKKIYVILIVLVIVFFIVMFLLFGLDELKKGSINTTLVVGKDTVWNYSGKKWKNVDSYEKLNWEKYDIYVNNEKKGNYYLWYNDKWYAFDDNKKAIKLEGTLLGVKSNIDIPVYNFSTDIIDNYVYVDEVLEEHNLPTNNDYTVNEMIVFDYDNDGIEEEFYVVSNAFTMDSHPEKIFSLVFMVKNEEIYPIYTDISENKGFNGCMPYISSFIDVDNDSKYEFIFSCSKYSVSGITRMLYEFKNNEFKILISEN